MIGVVLLVFSVEYILIADLQSATFYNKNILSTLPGFDFVRYWFQGAFLSPLGFMATGYYDFPTMTCIVGFELLIIFCPLIAVLGNTQEKCLAMWGLLFNALILILVSLGRYKFPLEKAYSMRYVYFTMIGAILVIGSGYNAFSRRFSRRFWHRSILMFVISIAILLQIITLPTWKRIYLPMVQQAKKCYDNPGLIETGQPIWLTPHHPLRRDQIEFIKKYLKSKN